MAKLLPFRRPTYTDATIAPKIAAVAADSNRVVVTNHAKKRMRKRKVLLSQVLDVLRGGVVVEPAHQNARGEWCCTLEKRSSGDLVKIPVVLMEENGELIVIVTVMN